MYQFKIIMILLMIFSVALFSEASAISGDADGIPAAAAASEEPKNKIVFGECKAAAVYECTAGTLLAGLNENEPLPAGHLAKLMTFLIAAEKITAGELSENETAVCSHYANSQQGSQIWLDEGEKISVGELMKAISIGNANDACVCLAEKIAADESSFTGLENRKAEILDMQDSFFEDSTGNSPNTVLSAADACRLCSELVKLDSFSPYFTTWMDTVRGGKAELVSRNRLMRSYKGIKGFKVCRTDKVGECAAVCAKRGDMTVCAVVLGAADEDALFEQVRKLLDSAFASYEVYYPEIPEEAAADIKVEHGVKPECMTNIPGLSAVIIPKGSYRSVTSNFERTDKLTAPVKTGTPVGNIVFSLGDDTLAAAEICSAEDVDEVDFGFALKRVLFNLLNF